MITTWREDSKEKKWFVTNVEGMRVHWLPVPYSNKLNYASRIIAFSRFAFAAARRAVSLKCDIIFASSTPLTIALPAVYAARIKRVPMVFEVRDLWPEVPIAIGVLRNPLARWAARRLERFAYKNASRVVALSPGMAAGVAATGYPNEHVIIVPNFSDLNFFQREPSRGQKLRRELGISKHQILVGYAGTLGRINGVGYLVRVAAALQCDSRFVFAVVGDGQEREVVENLARELGVWKKTFFLLPTMPKEDIPAVLSSFDIASSVCLPIPELESNSANKFFDALAAGCCVAINYGGWQAELLKEFSAGLRLSSDPVHAASELQALADDPERIKTFGQNARRLAEERFSRDKLTMIIENVLAEAVAESAAGSVIWLRYCNDFVHEPKLFHTSAACHMVSS
jgi:glycosyltransferase involved in cell wall biosynthesis